MDLGLKNKTVLITGGSSCIGKETALTYAKEICNISGTRLRKPFPLFVRILKTIWLCPFGTDPDKIIFPRNSLSFAGFR